MLLPHIAINTSREFLPSKRRACVSYKIKTNPTRSDEFRNLINLSLSYYSLLQFLSPILKDTPAPFPQQTSEYQASIMEVMNWFWYRWLYRPNRLGGKSQNTFVRVPIMHHSYTWGWLLLGEFLVGPSLRIAWRKYKISWEYVFQCVVIGVWREGTQGGYCWGCCWFRFLRFVFFVSFSLFRFLPFFSCLRCDFVAWRFQMLDRWLNIFPSRTTRFIVSISLEITS